MELGKNVQTQAHYQANASPVWRRHELGQPRAVDNALTLFKVWPFKNMGAILGHANAAAYARIVADNMHGCGKF